MMAVLSLVVVVAAPLAGPPEPAVIRGPAPRYACSSLDVRPAPPQASRSTSRTWSARRVVDLEIRASLRPARRPGRVELRVLTPGGHLYQTLTATASRPASPSRGRSLTGVVAAARLPVAGTHITQRGLYGVWSVVPYIEGGREPCGPAATFTFVP